MWVSLSSQFVHVWRKFGISASLLAICLTGCQGLGVRSNHVQRSSAPSPSLAKFPDRQDSRAASLPLVLVNDCAAPSPRNVRRESWELPKLLRDAPPRHTPQTETAAWQPGEFWQSLWRDDSLAPCCPCSSNVCDWSCDTDCGWDECPSNECEFLCPGCDMKGCFPRLWEDAKGVVNWNNGLILGAAAGVAIAIRESGADDDVREWVNESPRRWGHASHTLGYLGNFEVQAPILLSLYGYSVWSQDSELHHLSGSLLSAFSITGVTTTALKLIIDTDRPSDHWMDGDYGFPSYHTASSFAIAAVLDEYYGCEVGLPAYALATAIGFSRIDERDHDLSDVVFGGALGFVIGKAVAGRHLCGNSKIQFSPYVHPTSGAAGLCCEAKF